MPFYTKRAGKKLKEAMADLASLTRDQRLDLKEEIDLARIMAERAVTIYDKVVVEDQEDKFDPHTKAAASAALKDALNHVTSLVAQHAKVEALASDKVSVGNIKWIADQVILILHEEIQDKDVIEKCVARVEQLRLLKQADAENKVLICLD